MNHARNVAQLMTRNIKLNNCHKWAEINDIGKENIDFNDIYSNDRIVLNRVIDAIEEVWELKFANGRMKGTR